MDGPTNIKTNLYHIEFTLPLTELHFLSKHWPIQIYVFNLFKTSRGDSGRLYVQPVSLHSNNRLGMFPCGEVRQELK